MTGPELSAGSERAVATRRIAAPAADIFALITDPNGHVRIDGSGMLVAAPDARPVRAVGDTFVIDMDREPLGDLPMGRYTVTNTVTRYEQDRELAWTVASELRPPAGHVYGYLLEPAGTDSTDVSNYYDWSAITDAARARIGWPVVPPTMMDTTLAKLAAILES